jgi:alpha-L-rhamnosidase
MVTRIEGHFQLWLSALINVDEVNHFRLTGSGTLDGNGAPFWAEFRRRSSTNRSTTNLDVERPRLVFIRDSHDVEVSGLHFKDSGFWNLHIYRCNNVLVDGLDTQAGTGSPSTDGMDIDSSQNVTIHNCRISVNDDCIALKGSKGPLAMDDKDSPPVEHIRITNCTFIRGGAIVTCGSEATIVRDVVVEHCTVAPTDPRSAIPLLRLKLRPDTPQAYSDIHIRDITANNAGSLISVAPWTQYFDLQGHEPPKSSASNISISGVKGTLKTFGSIRGNKGNTIDNITLENIDVQIPIRAATQDFARGRGQNAGPTTRPNFVGVTNLVVKNVKVNGEEYVGE